MTETKGRSFGKGPHIMGIVNVTPDSFSDGGRFLQADKAIAHGRELIRQGADILDIGGESTRPGARPVSVDKEIKRLRPVIDGLKGQGAWLSVDTRNARTMEMAIQAGADLINDISALSHDPASVRVIAEADVKVILMHMRGTPETMQEKTIYNNVLDDIFKFFEEKIDFCLKRGIALNRIIIDPGIGFAKTHEQSLLMIGNINKFHRFGVPVLIGASRKSFIGKVSDDEPAADRLGGSLAAALWAVKEGVQIVRVHDVKETRQAFRVFRAIEAARTP